VRFAYSLPWWGWILVIAGVVFAAYGAYTRTNITLAPRRRFALSGLRALALLLLALFLLRPVRLLPPTTPRNQPVPILVDVSRSMSLTEAGGKRRIEHAAEVLTKRLLPVVSSEFQPEVFTFGESLAPGSPAALTATARRSDLGGALQAVREHYRGRPLGGIVMVSDGGDTSGQDAAAMLDRGTPPVFTVGIGDAEPRRDRELLSLTAGEASVENALVDLSVSAVSRGYGTAPIKLRLLANGQPIDTRSIAPGADGSPIQATFLVAPDRTSPTIFTVEIADEGDEAVPENNRRSVLVSPPGRARRLLFVQGAPGFEHSFIKRAWEKDASLDLDAVVRKGKNDRGQDTFYLQVTPARGPALLSGFPGDRRALYTYDALVFGNVEGDFLTRDQLTLAADFVAERGGGLLVFGALSFARGGFIGTALEEALPLELNDRRGGLARTSAQVDDGSSAFKVMVTREGETHPVMRLGLDREETLSRWRAAPALASTAMLGSPRPGAQVLAVTATPNGEQYPLVAVQRYGRGRSMIVAGEGSWRWRMGLPATDRTHEIFWRQVARWLSADAPDPVSISEIGTAMPGDTLTIDTLVRDTDFVPVPDATVTLRVTLPGGATKELSAAPLNAGAGLYRTVLRADQGGVYRVTATARRGTAGPPPTGAPATGTPVLGTSDRWTLVGGADLEMADPQLNEDVLKRLAAASGGRYLREADLASLPALLKEPHVDAPPPDQRDLWNNSWMLGVIIGLLSTEWVLRRRWGMR
jgi:uncharacterized membrane protein